MEKVKEFIDYCESKFNDINGLLDDVGIDTIDKIIGARDIAYNVGEDLY